MQIILLPPNIIYNKHLVKKKNLVPYDHHLAQVVTANLLGPGIGIVTTVTQARPLDVVLKKKIMIEIVPVVKMSIERTVHSISKAMLLHQEDHLLQIKVERIPQSYRIMIRILDMIILKEQMFDFRKNAQARRGCICLLIMIGHVRQMLVVIIP